MKRTIALAAGLALLAGCSPAPTPVPAQVTTPIVAPSDSDTVDPEPTPSAPTSPAANERGHIPKKLGEQAVLVDGNGDEAVRFTVTKIEPGFKCNSGYSEKSAHGHYLAIWMEIRTTKAVDFDSDDSNVIPYFNPGDWQVTSKEGTTENDSDGNSYSCAKDSIALPSQLGPSKKVKGVVVLDTKYKHGHLAMVPDFMQSGWEWDF